MLLWPAGGLKLWECAVDLANYLADLFWSPIPGQARRTEGMRGMRVMELGCGHGLPGIICALAGAEVCFQVTYAHYYSTDQVGPVCLLVQLLVEVRRKDVITMPNAGLQCRDADGAHSTKSAHERKLASGNVEL
jgi:predicted nicotinamide N-methyase